MSNIQIQTHNSLQVNKREIIICCLGFWGITPESIEKTREFIEKVKRVGKKCNVEVRVRKADPSKPMEVWNPDLLVANGEHKDLLRFIRILRFKGLITHEDYEELKRVIEK